MVNTKIRLIIFFATKYAEALYSQQSQDQELIVAQIMNSLLQNSEIELKIKIEESRGNHWPFGCDLNQIPMIIQWK